MFLPSPSLGKTAFARLLATFTILPTSPNFRLRSTLRIADIDFWVGNHRDDEYLYELRLT